MSKLIGPSAYNLPMPVFPFIKSEPKEPEQKSHFFPHIKYELEEAPIKVELEDIPLTLRYGN